MRVADAKPVHIIGEAANYYLTCTYVEQCVYIYIVTNLNTRIYRRGIGSCYHDMSICARITI